MVGTACGLPVHAAATMPPGVWQGGIPMVPPHHYPSHVFGHGMAPVGSAMPAGPCPPAADTTHNSTAAAPAVAERREDSLPPWRRVREPDVVAVSPSPAASGTVTTSARPRSHRRFSYKTSGLWRVGPQGDLFKAYQATKEKDANPKKRANRGKKRRAWFTGHRKWPSKAWDDDDEEDDDEGYYEPTWWHKHQPWQDWSSSRGGGGSASRGRWTWAWVS
eukprot:Skav228727  [mRNA]  locus=scaffold1830:359893:360702:+ [translate_table: standard]